MVSLALNPARMAPAASGLAAAALLCGCTVGPNFHRPAVPVKPTYRPAGESNPVDTAAAAAERHAPAADAYRQRIALGGPVTPEWWRLFRSSGLDELMQRAMSGNHGLAAAKATLAQARELVAAQSGQL